MGLHWLRDWSLYVLWLRIMLSSPIDWTKSMPTPFCFLVTNSHCKKVSTCVMAKAKAVPKCFSCKILERCLQCQWVLVTSFGVGSLSSFGWIKWEHWYQKPWINFKSFYCLVWFVRDLKYRTFPLRKAICMKESQIFISQVKRTRPTSFFSQPSCHRWGSATLLGHDGGTSEVPYRRSSSSNLATCNPGWSSCKWIPFLF